jgi:hypothetical protein
MEKIYIVVETDKYGEHWVALAWFESEEEAKIYKVELESEITNKNTFVFVDCVKKGG